MRQNYRFTPRFINYLRPNEVFVFGSNLAGIHDGGASLVAWQRFGARWGQGSGPQGQSYAIPTMHGNINAISHYVDHFIAYAMYHPEKTFLVTAIGCGTAGFTPYQIAPLFAQALMLPNVVLPESFAAVLTGA